MHKEDISQLELFSPGNEKQPAGLSEPAFSVSFLSYIRVYEKIIFVLIGFIITAVVAFCFGVERGKTMAGNVTNVRMDLAAVPVAPVKPVAAQAAARKAVQPAALTVVPAAGQIAVRPRVPAPVASNRKMVVAAPSRLVSDRPAAVQPAAAAGAFTVQVGSYQEYDLAKKESALLKKQGFNALLIRKGKYTVLCVGNFTSKENAQSALSKLRRTYGDCYIRRM